MSQITKKPHSFTTWCSNWEFRDENGDRILEPHSKEREIMSFTAFGEQGVGARFNCISQEDSSWEMQIFGPKYGNFQLLADMTGYATSDSHLMVTYLSDASIKPECVIELSKWAALSDAHIAAFPVGTSGVLVTNAFLAPFLIPLVLRSNLRLQVSISHSLLSSRLTLFKAMQSSDRPNLLEIIQSVRANKKGYDLELVPSFEENSSSEDEESSAIPVHKSILLKYQFFRDMLNSGMSESVSLNSTSTVEEDQLSDLRHSETSASKKTLPTISMDLDYVTLKAVVDSMYGEEIAFTLTHLNKSTVRRPYLCDSRKAWIAAEKYGFDRLRTLAARHLITHLTCETVLSDLVLSKEAVSSELSDIYLAYAFLDHNYIRIVESDAFEVVFKELATGLYPAASGELLAKLIRSQI